MISHFDNGMGENEVDERLAVGQEISALLTLLSPEAKARPQDGTDDGGQGAGCDQVKPTWTRISPSSDPKTHFTRVRR